MFKENCWFLYGIRIGSYYLGYRKYHSEGDFASVSFDWRVALNKRLLGWSHTHSGGEPFPSLRDHLTMSGWVIGTGKPLMCDIVSDNRNKCWLFGKKNPRCRKSSEIIHCSIGMKYYGALFIGKLYTEYSKKMVKEYKSKNKGLK